MNTDSRYIKANIFGFNSFVFFSFLREKHVMGVPVFDALPMLYFKIFFLQKSAEAVKNLPYFYAYKTKFSHSKTILKI